MKVLFITFGLTGTGKSTAANIMKDLIPSASLYRSDIIRKRLAGISLKKRVEVPYETGIYSPLITEKVYNHLFKLAEQDLKKNKTVILDASFLRRKWRNKVREIAKKTNAEFYLLWTYTPKYLLRERFEQRKKSVSDGRMEIYNAQRSAMDPLDKEEAFIKLDMRQPVEKIYEILSLLVNMIKGKN